MDYNPWMSNLKNCGSSVCKKTGELQRFMYFHYSSQCEAKCAFLALRIYCWRLRTKIVSLIIRNPTTPLTLKPWSSSHHHLALQSRTFATTDQQWGQYFLEVVFELKIFILRSHFLYRILDSKKLAPSSLASQAFERFIWT